MPPPNLASCDVCGNQYGRASLAIHRARCLDGAVPCPTCGKELRDEMLRGHMRVCARQQHHRVSPRSGGGGARRAPGPARGAGALPTHAARPRTASGSSAGGWRAPEFTPRALVLQRSGPRLEDFERCWLRSAGGQRSRPATAAAAAREHES
jgi:hypothetical protein